MTIKRKFTNDSSGQVKKWLFVIHDTENTLLELQEKWDEIMTHTGWKLENCYKPPINEIQEFPIPADICTPSTETTVQADVTSNCKSQEDTCQLNSEVTATSFLVS